jgi:hypothetical protein
MERMPLTEKDRKRRRRQRRQKKVKLLKKGLAEATDTKTKKKLIEKIRRYQPWWEGLEE